MAYVLSKLTNTQVYTKYVKGINNMNIPQKQIEIKGGADIANKNLITPEGVITTVSDDELEILKQNPDFMRHVEKGHIKYYALNPNLEKEAGKLEKDNSAPKTPDDYEKQGKKKPKTSKQEL